MSVSLDFMLKLHDIFRKAIEDCPDRNIVLEYVDFICSMFENDEVVNDSSNNIFLYSMCGSQRLLCEKLLKKQCH